MALFSDLNPYHWPGWFVSALAVVHATAVIFCFTEIRSLACIRNKSSCPSRLKLSAKLRSKKKVQFAVSLGMRWYSLFITLKQKLTASVLVFKP